MTDKRCISVFLSGVALGASLLLLLPALSPVLGIGNAAASCDGDVRGDARPVLDGAVDAQSGREPAAGVAAPSTDPPTCHAEEGTCPRHPGQVL